jgi:hypothetical protein
MKLSVTKGSLQSTIGEVAKMQSVDLKRRTVPIHGKKYHVLGGKPTAIPNRTLYLLNTEGEEFDYSLWLAEPDDNDKERIDMWPYEGPDTEKLKLIKQLLEEFVATAFE